MAQYLIVEQVLRINARVLGQEAPALRDQSVLESAVARPIASEFGEDAYPTLTEKAAALLHSLVLNHPLISASDHAPTLDVLMPPRAYQPCLIRRRAFPNTQPHTLRARCDRFRARCPHRQCHDELSPRS